ncbi:MAG: daptide-type RiPP biosynthesis methyltransferase [Actinomycetota bacterium]
MQDGLTNDVRRRLRRSHGRAVIQDLYVGEGARFYERLIAHDRSEVREVLRHARETTGDVLDLAAGGGRLTVPLLRSGRRVTALDLSEDMLALLRSAATGSMAENLEIVASDMTDFDLSGEFGLIVIGATSISLLDPSGRRRLYAAVRRHLSSGGRFVFSAASENAVTAMTSDASRMLNVPDERGPVDYLFSQQLAPSGQERLVNFVEMSGFEHPGRTVTVFTGRVRLVRPSVLAAELVEAGFAPPTTHRVRAADESPTAEIVLLATAARSES